MRTISIRSKHFVSIFVLVLAIGIPSSLSAESEGEGFDFKGALIHHLMDSVVFEFHLGGVKVRPGSPEYEKTQFVKSYTFKDERGLYRYSGGVPLHITRRTAMMFVVSALLLIVLITAARAISKNPRRVNSRLGNAIEALVQWMRNDVAGPSMHGHSKGFEPFILTLFFFIFAMNLLGLFPPIGELSVKAHHMLTGHEGGHHLGPGETEPGLIAVWPAMTVTGDVSVTLTLSLISTALIWITGFRYQGFKFLWHSVPDGVPAPLYVIMWPLEFIIGPLSKGFALTIRLLANMTGGHVIILALIGFVFLTKNLILDGGILGAVGGAGIIAVSIMGAIAIYFLEILVAFLQAFIFAMLTSLFIGSSMHRH